LYKELYINNNQKILVVDDEPLVLSTVSNYLESLGYNIDTAQDGKIAAEKLMKNVYDLVLTDLKMPNMDGRDLMRFMAEKFPDIPKIVLTGYGEDEDIILALKAGANDFLFKPISDFAFLNHSIQKALEIKKLRDEKNKYYEQLKQINDIITLLNRGNNTEEIFNYLSVSLKKMIHFNRLSLWQIDRANKKIIIKMIHSDKKIIPDKGFSHEIDLNLVEDPRFKHTLVINDLENLKQPYDNLSHLSIFLISEGIRSFLLLPLSINDEIRGYLNLSSIIPGFFNKEHLVFMESIAGHIALSIQRGGFFDNLEINTKKLQNLVDLRTNEILKTQRTTLFALTKLAEVRDRETGEHLERIRRYSILTAQIYKYTNNKNHIDNIFLRDLYDSSILHDIGKVGIPDIILRKEGPLTQEEFEIIKNHIYIGYNALKSASKDLGENSFLNMAMDIILYHHEHWDGSGYPKGLKGEEIPLSARIVTISDIYDALVSKRPYKNAYSHDESIKIMKEQESDFDPDLFKIFTDNAADYDLIKKQFMDK
jgi:response regulator RpfG family c-di-GMP phosphodiesterase